MKKEYYIKLSNGENTILDFEDYRVQNKHKWNFSNGYARRSKYIGGGRKNPKLEQIYLHRVITNAPKNLQVDHINHNRLDNRKSNLRLCTASENQKNRIFKERNPYLSICPGVCRNTEQSKWMAYIGIDGKNRFLGNFTNIKDAVTARYMAVLERIDKIKPQLLLD